MKKKAKDPAKALARGAAVRARERYLLRLYVAGITPKSERAIRSIKDICEQFLTDRYTLEIVDIYQQPDAVREEQIVVAPTLIKKLPLPLRRLIGDMADKEKVVVGLDLRLET